MTTQRYEYNRQLNRISLTQTFNMRWLKSLEDIYKTCRAEKAVCEVIVEQERDHRKLWRALCLIYTWRMVQGKSYWFLAFLNLKKVISKGIFVFKRIDIQAPTYQIKLLHCSTTCGLWNRQLILLLLCRRWNPNFTLNMCTNFVYQCRPKPYKNNFKILNLGFLTIIIKLWK